MSNAYWMPTKPYNFIDSINRSGAATGSIRYAALASDADYNGHAVSLSYRPLAVGGARWVGEYFWAGRRVVARGSFGTCLAQCIEEYKRQGLGASLVIHLGDAPVDERELCERAVREAGLVPHSREISEAHFHSFTSDVDWRFDEARYRYSDTVLLARLANTNPKQVTQAEFRASR